VNFTPFGIGFDFGDGLLDVDDLSGLTSPAS
jgi:hypothetical protein